MRVHGMYASMNVYADMKARMFEWLRACSTGSADWGDSVIC